MVTLEARNSGVEIDNKIVTFVNTADRGPLLQFDLSTKPYKAILSEDTRIWLTGDQYFAWFEGDETWRVTGGSIGTFDYLEPIAHILRRSVPLDSPAWAPKPLPARQDLATWLSTKKEFKHEA